MWSSHTKDELKVTFTDAVSNHNSQCFIKYHNNTPVGFALCSLRRDYVEGTSSSPVGYLEGIFVEDDFRGRRFAAELLKACESWAKSLGCTEFASDCELQNQNSLRFHFATGFEEAGRIICFRKDI